jgi:tetratricopeptide (TPR) repeat protein
MSERTVTVATFAEPVQAHLAKNRLESAGIKSFLANQETVGMSWHLGIAFGGIQLQVLETDADDARAILAENVSDDPEPSDEAGEDSPPEDAESTAETEPTSREKNANRAAKAAILGLLLTPVQLYAFWLLLKVSFSKEHLGAVQRRRAMVAAVINLPMMFGCGIVAAWPWLGPFARFGRDELQSPLSAARSAAFHFHLAENAFEKGNAASALKHYSLAIELAPEFAAAYERRGDVYANQADHDLAIADFSRAIELDPSVQRVFNSRGSSYRERGDYKAALADHDEAIKLSPEDWDSYLERAEDYRVLGNDERAFADFDQSIRMAANHVTYAARALAFFETADYARAIEDCNEVLRLKPDYFRGHSLRGMALASLGRYDDAIADYNLSLQMNPRNYHDLTVRGMAYAGKGDVRSALADFDSAITIDPRAPQAYFERAKAHRILGDDKSADRDEEEARRRADTQPTTSETHAPAPNGF